MNKKYVTSWVWRCGLLGEQWDDLGDAPMSLWLKTSMNHHFRLKFLCVCVFFVFYNSHHSVLPESNSLEMDIRTSCVISRPSAPPNNFQFLSQTCSPRHCFLSLERPKWNMYIGTSGSGEGKLVGWLETSVQRERSQPFDRKNDWQWVFAQLADMRTQRWVSGEGQNGTRRARMQTTNKVKQTVSPSKLQRGKRAFEVIVDLRFLRVIWSIWKVWTPKHLRLDTWKHFSVLKGTVLKT